MNKLYFCLSFFYFVFSFPALAQQGNDEFLSSLKEKSSPDRVRHLTSNFLGKVKQDQKESLKAILKDATLFAQKHQDPLFLETLGFLKQTRSFLTKLDPEKRIGFYRKLIHKYQSKENSLLMGVCLHYISQNQFVLEEYGLSFENSSRAQKIFEQIGYENVPNIGKYLHDLALNYYFFKDYKKVVQAMKTSIQLPKFNDNLDIQRYNTLGMAYFKSGKLDSASFYLERAHKKAENYRDSVWMGLVAGNIGEVFFAKQKYKQALPYFFKNYQLNKNTLKHLAIGREACTDLAKLYLATDSLDKAYRFNRLAENYFPDNKHFSFGEQQQFERIKKQYHENFYRYYLKTGDYKKALLYRDSLERAESIIDSKYNTSIIKMSKDKLRINEKKLQLEQLKAQSQVEISKRNLAIAIVVFLLFGTGATFLYRNKYLMNKQRIKELELKNTHEALSNAKIRLSSLAQKVKENNTLIQTLQKSKEPVNQKTLQELKRSTILTTEDWAEYQILFEKAYPGFIKKLKENHQALTPSERRCLCLEKLNLSNNEMAAVLGVSPNSIMVTKHRIRKKMDIEDQEALEVFVKAV